MSAPHVHPLPSAGEAAAPHLGAAHAYRVARLQGPAIPCCWWAACDCRLCSLARATTPPPVRVIRLADGPASIRHAANAAEIGVRLIPHLLPAGTFTVENGDEERWCASVARRAKSAARLARLALGVSS